MCWVGNRLEENFWWEVAALLSSAMRGGEDWGAVCTVPGKNQWLCPLHACHEVGIWHIVTASSETGTQHFPGPCCRQSGRPGPVDLGGWAVNTFGVRRLWLDLLLFLTPGFPGFGLCAKMLSAMCSIPTKLSGHTWLVWYFNGHKASTEVQRQVQPTALCAGWDSPQAARVPLFQPSVALRLWMAIGQSF